MGIFPAGHSSGVKVKLITVSEFAKIIENQGKHGVGDGIRTRDVQIHSLALYQTELHPPEQRVKGKHAL